MDERKDLCKENKVNFTFDCWCILWLNDCNASSQKKQTQKMSCSHGYRLLVSSSELRGLSHWIYILVCFSVGRMQSNRCMQLYVGIGWSILGLSSSPPQKKNPQTHKNQTDIRESDLLNLIWKYVINCLVFFFCFLSFGMKIVFKIKFWTQDQRP